jgi:hypothetical protein
LRTLDGHDGLEAVLALADDDHVGVLRDLKTQPLAGGGFVVDDENSERHAAAFVSYETGSLKVARRPPEVLTTSRLAAPPYWASSRSRAAARDVRPPEVLRNGPGHALLGEDEAQRARLPPRCDREHARPGTPLGPLGEESGGHRDEEERGDRFVQDLRGDLHFHREPAFEPETFDPQVEVQRAELLTERHGRAGLGAKRHAQELAQVEDELRGLGRLRHHEPSRGGERAEEERRVELRRERGEPGRREVFSRARRRGRSRAPPAPRRSRVPATSAVYSARFDSADDRLARHGLEEPEAARLERQREHETDEADAVRRAEDEAGREVGEERAEGLLERVRQAPGEPHHDGHERQPHEREGHVVEQDAERPRRVAPRADVERELLRGAEDAPQSEPEHEENAGREVPSETHAAAASGASAVRKGRRISATAPPPAPADSEKRAAAP